MAEEVITRASGAAARTAVTSEGSSGAPIVSTSTKSGCARDRRQSVSAVVGMADGLDVWMILQPEPH